MSHICRLIFCALLTFSIADSVSAQQLEIRVEKRIRLEAVGDADVWMWQAPPALTVEQRGNLLLVDGPAGTYRVHVTALSIDWDNRQFSQQNGFIDLEIGGEPDVPNPPPDPNPDVPDDEFDNIGERVNIWSRELGLNRTNEAAANYEIAAARLLGEQTPILPTIDSAHEFIREANGALDLNDSWVEWGRRVNEVWQAHVEDRSSAGRFLRAVSVGLKGG